MATWAPRRRLWLPQDDDHSGYQARVMARRRHLLALMTALACALPVGAALGRYDRQPAWTRARDSELARTEVAAAAVGRSIYVLGGYAEGGAPTAAVERYDTADDRWQLVAPMPVALNHAAAASRRGALYVAGGYTGAPFSLGLPGSGSAGASRDLWRYDPGADTWSRMPPAPTARGAAATAVIGDELYLAGGGDELRALRTFEIFDFTTRTWRRGPDLPLATEHVSGMSYGGDFYVFGGRPAYGGGVYSTAFRYRPGAGQWERLTDMRRGRAGFAAVESCAGPVVYGGEDPGSTASGTVAEAERYDTRLNRWEPLPDMPTARHGLGGGAVGDRAYALEGGPVTFLAVSRTSEALELHCRADRLLRLDLRMLDRRLGAVRRRRALRVRLRSSQGGYIRLVARARGRTVARGRTRLGARAKVVRLRLTARGVRMTRRPRRLRVSVTARTRARDGALVRRTVRRTLRR